MATKGVWQLRKLTVRYCQRDGSSRHIREFIKDEQFLQFASSNPQIEFHTQIKPGRHPVLIGEYVTNETKVCDIKNQPADFIHEQMTRLRNTSGRKMTRLPRSVKTRSPSIQGLWEQNISSDDFQIQHI